MHFILDIKISLPDYTPLPKTQCSGKSRPILPEVHFVTLALSFFPSIPNGAKMPCSGFYPACLVVTCYEFSKGVPMHSCGPETFLPRRSRKLSSRSQNNLIFTLYCHNPSNLWLYSLTRCLSCLLLKDLRIL